MLRIDENALICDLAEVYNIYDYRSLPPSRVAAFAVGLRNNSRIKTKMRGDDLRNNELSDLILANIHDMLASYLLGSDRAPSILAELIGEANSSGREKTNENDLEVFDSAESFEEARNKILGGQTWPEQN